MAYADQKANQSVAIGSVVLVHVGLGAALLSGLAVKVFEPIDPPLITKNIPIENPPEPPPEHKPKPVTKAQPRPSARDVVTVPIRRVETDAAPTYPTTTIEYPPLPPAPPTPEPRPYIEPPMPTVSLARGLRPSGDQGRWFPQDSYPPAARRAGAEGRVSVSVDVGTDGRVIACRVTSSSGNGDLDAATCRLTTRNGRFEPARDASGAPTASTTALRNVRWALE
ncbi:TonB family protein [uncultured Sphingomonas sp.]|uniref:energy transducer TonB n=1 Tax=uncultured Sphingomonas sp. TaxID=158754 RepID=UPI0035CAA4EA